MRDVADEDKRNKPYHSFKKVGRKMKVVNENLELVDYEKKSISEEDRLNYELMSKLTLIDLMYDMNRNISHKMNFIMISAQLMILFISLTLQSIFVEFRLVISLAGALGSTIMMCLVIINTKLSGKAMKNANRQKELIENYIDKLAEGEEK